jgi:flagellar biogenesis protein FliO
MDFIQPIFAILFVLGLLGSVLFLLKKRGAVSFRAGALRAGQGRRMESVERLALGPQHALHLIRLDGKSILVATAPTSVQVLGEAGQL